MEHPPQSMYCSMSKGTQAVKNQALVVVKLRCLKISGSQLEISLIQSLTIL